MAKVIFTKLDSGNLYLYNRNNKDIIFSHPLIYACYIFYINSKKEKSFENFIQFLNKKDLKYYYGKFTFLLRSGAFEDPKRLDLVTEINSSTLKTYLANVEQLTFEVTDSCNLKCKYCGFGDMYNFNEKRDNAKLSFEKIQNIINFVMPLWNSTLNFSANKEIRISFYGGEPLLNIDVIKKSIEYLSKLKLQHGYFTYSMTTNGTLLKKHIKYLIEKDIHLLVSLDGNEINNSFRIFKNNRNSFSLIIDNLTFIKNRYPKYFEKNVNFNAVLHSKNSVEDIYTYFLDKFNKIARIAELNPMGIAKPEEYQILYNNITESIKTSPKKDEINEKMFLNLPQYKNLASFLILGRIIYQQVHASLLIKNFICQLMEKS